MCVRVRMDRLSQHAYKQQISFAYTLHTHKAEHFWCWHKEFRNKFFLRSFILFASLHLLSCYLLCCFPYRPLFLSFIFFFFRLFFYTFFLFKIKDSYSRFAFSSLLFMAVYQFIIHTRHYHHRLRCLLKLLQRGDVSAEVLQKNLHYAARVLEALYIDETK